jgi:DNA-binding NarL/FixJ family response regulator
MVRLLVAEDHPGMRDKVVRILEEEFSVVDFVGDGRQMLDAELRTKPDVVILDISMPTMGGIEAATLLKERDPEARIIFLTAHEDPEFLQAAMSIGALGYVIKSRLASDLRLAVTEAMAGRRFISPSLAAVACEVLHKDGSF